MKPISKSKRAELAQLQRDYEADCAAMRRAFGPTHPGLCKARLAVRAEQFDEDVAAVLRRGASSQRKC